MKYYQRAILIFLGFFVLSILNTNTAYAQKKRNKQKRAEISFDDELVEGEGDKPELFYLLQKKQFNFGRLIKLRENFIPEMRRTAEGVKRGK